MPRLTDAGVKALNVPAGKRDIKQYDDLVTGFGVRVTSTGKRSFFLNYTVHGREKRLTIGQYPTWGVAAAREHAAKLRRQADAGDDPQAERLRKRSEKTIEELWTRYELEVSSRKAASTYRNERSVWTRLILPKWKGNRLGDIQFSDVDKLHREISVQTPTQANRTASFLRHAFGKAIRWGWMEHNPATGVTRNHEQPRERFLTRQEFEKFIAALDRREDTASSLALRFILFTGCRSGEAFKATWREIDLENAVWTKPSAHTKNKRQHRVPLNRATLDVLLRARLLSNGDHVFPGKVGPHVVEIKKLFHNARREAGLENLRIHDLRHSFASFLASSGQPLHFVGRLLGHTQLSTTLRYAHLFDDPVRTASEVMSGMAEGQFDAEE